MVCGLVYLLTGLAGPLVPTTNIARLFVPTLLHCSLSKAFDRDIRSTIRDDAHLAAVRDEFDALQRGKGDPAILYAAFLSAAHSASTAPNQPTVPSRRKRSRRELEGFSDSGHPECPSQVCLAEFSALSRAMIRLVMSPEARLALQFLHVKSFPRHECEKCGSRMCFQCGEQAWHDDGETCEDHLRRRIGLIRVRTACHSDGKAPASDLQELQTLEWKLANGKRCPRCCIFIERDDGCNKMDCLYCGSQFCWQCLKAWNKDCGFYTCQSEPETVTLTPAQAAVAETAETAALEPKGGPSDYPGSPGWDAVPDVTARRDSDVSLRRDSDVSIDGVERSAKRAKAEAGVPDVTSSSFGKFRVRA
eukprot:Opistho-2@27600